MHLALSLWSRSGVLLELGNGPQALTDLLYAVECGLPAKQHAAYYLRLSRAHASEYSLILYSVGTYIHIVINNLWRLQCLATRPKRTSAWHWVSVCAKIRIHDAVWQA